MDFLRQSDLHQLLEVSATPCVSVFTPIQRAGKETQQNPVRLRNGLDEAQSRLTAAGMRRAEACELLKPGRDLQANASFWREQQGDGLALFLAPGSARPKRIHAPLLTEEETLRLVDWLKERGRPDYHSGLLNAMETEEEPGEGAPDATGAAGDDVYQRAVAVVKRERKASTSLLQRKLNIGYGRAARMIDRMEDEGIIGADRGVGKPREVLAGED